MPPAPPASSSLTTTSTTNNHITNSNNNTTTTSSGGGGEYHDDNKARTSILSNSRLSLSRLLYNTCGGRQDRGACGGGGGRGAGRYTMIYGQQQQNCYNNCHILHEEGQGHRRRHESQGEITVYNKRKYEEQHTAATTTSSSVSINSVSRSLSHQSALPYFSTSSSSSSTLLLYGDDGDDDYTTCNDNEDNNNTTTTTITTDTNNNNNVISSSPPPAPAAASAVVAVKSPPPPPPSSSSPRLYSSPSSSSSSPRLYSSPSSSSSSSSSSASLSDDFLLGVYNKAVNYCTPLYDVTGMPGWVSQNNGSGSINGFSKLRNIKANVRNMDDGGKLCRLDCDFPEYTVNEVYNTLYDKRDQKDWNHLVESVNFIDNNITMPSLNILHNTSSKLECHALSTKYYSPIPYFKPELRELRMCYTPPPSPQDNQQQQQDQQDQGSVNNIDKHFIIASSDYKPLYDLPYDKGRTATYVHLSVQMITSLISYNDADADAAGHQGAHFTYVLDLNNIPKFLPVNTLGVHNTVKFVTCLEKELSRIYGKRDK